MRAVVLIVPRRWSLFCEIFFFLPVKLGGRKDLSTGPSLAAKGGRSNWVLNETVLSPVGGRVAAGEVTTVLEGRRGGGGGKKGFFFGDIHPERARFCLAGPPPRFPASVGNHLNSFYVFSLPLAPGA